ncbi:hypothetical protein [Streptomyces sp. NPDC056296]|uniref:hypothetical protein n=1 Tax=Streptomyces sp. NPDC056296 TaxID=3345775 RepID=UPI0035DF2D49
MRSRPRRGPRRVPRRRTSALLAVSALTGGLLLTAPQPASAANLITNPGFETAGTGDMPYCWSKSGWGDNDFTFETVADAHTGTNRSAPPSPAATGTTVPPTSACRPPSRPR